MYKPDKLIDKFIERSISADEREILERWVLENEANLSVFKNSIKKANSNISTDFDADSAYQGFLAILESKNKKPKYLLRIMKYAAIFIAILAIGFLIENQLFPDSSGASLDVVKKLDGNSADDDGIILRLPGGRIEILAADGNGRLTDKKGNTVANKAGNSLRFGKVKESVEGTVEFNEIFIPFGQTFKLELSDGTLVWLNAGSKLRFPQNFVNTEKNRTVYLEGEAYFDVTKNEQMPFIVNTQEVDIKVLGTEFNISSYESDDYIATTLVEGSVSVYETRTPENGLQLMPSFQAKYDKFGNNFKKTKVDTNRYTAWMQNRLIIDSLNFSEILVKLERRYFVKFVNNAKGLDDEIYKGEFVDEDIESVLKTISLSTPFSYEINQNVITITDPK